MIHNCCIGRGQRYRERDSNDNYLSDSHGILLNPESGELQYTRESYWDTYTADQHTNTAIQAAHQESSKKTDGRTCSDNAREAGNVGTILRRDHIKLLYTDSNPDDEAGRFRLSVAYVGLQFERT
ncbi:hypothetical protein E8E14_002743 [Neopestalotiopsis sp. 37M]|nr:hypothetical protein E8E14_002743 [Neopestalotiopsis sp. 37M]